MVSIQASDHLLGKHTLRALGCHDCRTRACDVLQSLRRLQVRNHHVFLCGGSRWCPIAWLSELAFAIVWNLDLLTTYESCISKNEAEEEEEYEEHMKNHAKTRRGRNIDNIFLMTNSQDNTNIETYQDIASTFLVLLSSREPECAEIGWIGAVPHLNIQIHKIIMCCLRKFVPKYKHPPPHFPLFSDDGFNQSIFSGALVQRKSCACS